MQELMLEATPVKQKKDVLVLGLGFAGTRIASKIDRKIFDVLVVDRKSYFEFSPSIISALGNANKVTSITVTPEDILKPNEFLQADLGLLSRNKATLKFPAPPSAAQLATLQALHQRGWRVRIDETQTSAEVLFDYCVVCIGSAYPSPIRSFCGTVALRQEEMRNFSQRLASPGLEKIIVEGGGYVAVETALRAKEVAKSPVEIYVRSDTILRNVPKEGQDKARQILTDKGIPIRFNRTSTPEELAK